MDEEVQAPPWSKDYLMEILGCYNGTIERNGHPYKSWHAFLQAKFTLHPSVVRMADTYRPKDYVQLALEFPHVSEKDSTRLAYTRSDADGANDRQLVTSIGKFLSRHWPHVEDHLRRDAQAAYSPDLLMIYNTTPEMIRAIEEGPRSCMASVYGSIPFDRHDREAMQKWFADKSSPEPDWSKHPYSCYRPDYGWSVATRTTAEGNIDGRALLYKGEFLRTYRRHKTDPTGWSETDFTLQEWLKHQGYKMVTSWPDGAQLHTPYVNGALFAPYIDGQVNTVAFDGNTTSEITDDDWTHTCTITNARVMERGYDDDDDGDEDEVICCPDCDEYYPDDDMTWVGRHEDRLVCRDCRDEHYIWARGCSTNGRGFFEYYVHGGDASSVEGQNYYIDTNHPPEKIVQLEDGDWAEIDDCVSIDGEYYLEDDYRIIYLEDSDDLDDSYGLRTYCYEIDGKWWKDEDHYLEFHPKTEEVGVEDLTTTVAAVSDERFALVA